MKNMVEDDVTDPINTLACIFATASRLRSDSARDALLVVAEKALTAFRRTSVSRPLIGL